MTSHLAQGPLGGSGTAVPATQELQVELGWLPMKGDGDQAAVPSTSWRMQPRGGLTWQRCP